MAHYQSRKSICEMQSQSLFLFGLIGKGTNMINAHFRSICGAVAELGTWLCCCCTTKHGGSLHQKPQDLLEFLKDRHWILMEMIALSCKGKEKLLVCEQGWLDGHASGLWGRALQTKGRRFTHPQGSRRNKELTILLKNKTTLELQSDNIWILVTGKEPMLLATWICRITLFWAIWGIIKRKGRAILLKNNHLPPASKK